MANRWFCALCALVLLTSCGTDGKGILNKPLVYVSIAPLSGIVSAIADTTLRVEVMVPETTSPETFEPTISQIKSLSDSRLYLAIGLIDFERALEQSIKSVAPNSKYVNLSSNDGLQLMAGQCNHSHSSGGGVPHSDGHHHTAEPHVHDHNSSGIDPHIWLSPSMLKIMARTVAQELSLLSPDNRELYERNLTKLEIQLDSLNTHIISVLADKKFRKFAIAHPSLTYYARDYSLTQIPIEMDGKEPSVKVLRGVIKELRDDTVSTILYQRQVSGASAEVIANEIGGKSVEFDPLARDAISNLRSITDHINQSLR